LLLLQHHCHRMDHRRDARGALYRLRGNIVLAQGALVRSHATAAAVDGGHGHRGEIEIDLVAAGIGHRVHPQAGAQPAVLVVLDEMQEAVIDVGHAHQCGSGARAIEFLLVGMLRGELRYRSGQRRVARCHRSRQGDNRDLFLAQPRRPTFAQYRLGVEAKVLGIVGQARLDAVHTHDVLQYTVKAAAGLLPPPWALRRWRGIGAAARERLRGLQGFFALVPVAGQSSSVCSASDGLRPTDPSVTYTKRITPSGSTRNAARLATPSSSRMPSARARSLLMSASIGKGKSRRSLWSLRHAMCTNSESVLAARIWQSRSLNCASRSAKPLISVGHTKVKSFG